MIIRRALYRRFVAQVARAPYRPPPVGRRKQERAARGTTLWALACAAALAAMLATPAVTGIGLGSGSLGYRVARTLESGAVQEFGAAALQTLLRSPPFQHRSL